MNFATQLPQRTWPHGLARTALERLLRPLLQAGHIRDGSPVPLSFSAAKRTVIRLFNEYRCFVDGVDAGQIGCSLLGFSFACVVVVTFDELVSIPGIQKEASVYEVESEHQ